MLTPAQAAFLAALPHRPSTFNPYRDPRGAQARQKRIIGRMRDLGYISPGDATIALAERLRLSREPSSFIAPHFVEMVLSASATGASSPAGAGVTADGGRPAVIDTTLDATLQRDVQGIIERERAALDKAGAHNVSVVVLDNATGGWLAWEGSGNYQDSEHGGTINGVLDAASAGLGAEAVHLRARLRRRPRSGERAGRRAVALSDGGTRRALQPAQLRRALPRSAARARRAGRLGERARRRAAVRPRRARRWCASCVRRASRRSTRPPRTTASA